MDTRKYTVRWPDMGLYTADHAAVVAWLGRSEQERVDRVRLAHDGDEGLPGIVRSFRLMDQLNQSIVCGEWGLPEPAQPSYPGRERELRSAQNSAAWQNGRQR